MSILPPTPSESESTVARLLSARAIEQWSRYLLQWLRQHTFAPLWLPAWASRTWSGYVVLIIVLTLTTITGLLLRQFVPDFHTFGLLELAAVAFIAVNWGVGPGLLASLLGATCLQIFLLSSPISINLVPPHLFSALLFLGLGSTISIGASKLEQARRQSNILALSLAGELVQEREQALAEQAASEGREMALREINRRMDEFLGMAGHELRTPLTVVKGSVQLTQRGLTRLTANEAKALQPFQQDLNTYSDLLERAERMIKVQERMVNDLLDTARLQSGRLVLNRTSTDLLQLVHQAVEDQRLIVPERQIVLQTACVQPLLICIDRDRIRQVITNLLTNALKYSAKDCSVIVRLEQRGQGARVSIIDQGAGIPQSEQERIWERFYRVESITARHSSSDGLGLGLHICRQIVQLHEGQIGLQSRTGEGSTFWLTLPIL